MSESVRTQLDRPYGQQPETRLAAVAYIARRGDAEMVLAALGLDDVQAPELAACPYCTTRLVKLCVWHGEHPVAPPAVPGPLVVDGRQCCPHCSLPLPDPIVNGGHKPCRRAACLRARTEAGAR